MQAYKVQRHAIFPIFSSELVCFSFTPFPPPPSDNSAFTNKFRAGFFFLAEIQCIDQTIDSN